MAQAVDFVALAPSSRLPAIIETGKPVAPK
jgi:hypothetical protein